MPGPVSDSYDPEFGTGANAQEVREALSELYQMLSSHLSDKSLHNIVRVAQSKDGDPLTSCKLTERDIRLIRFAIARAWDSI
jgi:hypothetical protein